MERGPQASKEKIRDNVLLFVALTKGLENNSGHLITLSIFTGLIIVDIARLRPPFVMTTRQRSLTEFIAMNGAGCFLMNGVSPRYSTVFLWDSEAWEVDGDAPSLPARSSSLAAFHSGAM